MKQDMKAYTAGDLKVWETLFNRQVINLQDKVCSEYLDALGQMAPVLNAQKIPDFREVDEWFRSHTGWQIEVVPGLIPVDDFFRLLADKKFCSSTWLRTMDQLDYLEEPDMFHDTFGHIPLLAHPVFSDFMQAFGELGCSFAGDEERVIALQRLYWFTIEFGMIGTQKQLIYGAGIISSFGESNRAVSATIEKLPFDMDMVLNKPFRTDVVQDAYVNVTAFDQLFRSIQQLKEQWTCVPG